MFGNLFSTIGGTALAGGLIAAVVAGWQHVKGFFATLRRMVICDVCVPRNSDVDLGLRYWLLQKGWLVPLRARHYDEFFRLDARGRSTYYLTENYGPQPYMLFFRGWRPLWITGTVSGGSASVRANDNSSPVATLEPQPAPRESRTQFSFLRWTFNPDRLARLGAVVYGRTFGGRWRPSRRRPRSGSELRMFTEAAYRRLLDAPASAFRLSRCDLADIRKRVIASDDIYALFHEVETWKAHREWYADRGIPWRRGWLLHGPPGSGKTSLIRNIANYTNISAESVHLATLNNEQLRGLWRKAGAQAPKILVIEDIDAVFDGRVNLLAKDTEAAAMGEGLAMAMRQMSQKRDAGPSPDDGFPPVTASFGPRYVTFDCLLNVIDGADTPEGIFLVVTTNNPKTLDPALAGYVPSQDGDEPQGAVDNTVGSRPGRLDRVIRLGYMEMAQKRRMVDIFLDDMPEQRKTLHAFLDAHPDLQETPAQMRERCVTAALDAFWNKQPPPRLRIAP